MSTKKLTIEIVRNYFESCNCVLLENEYKDCKTPMKYICVCGNESKICYSNLKNGQRCKQCANKKSAKANTKYTYDDVKYLVEEKECKLLSKKEDYSTSNSIITFVCNCGSQSKTTFSSFLCGRRCYNCRSERMAIKKRRPIEKVCEIFEKEGYTLLSDSYVNVNMPLSFHCPRGHEHQISLSNWKKGQRCRKCYEEDRLGPNHPNWCQDREAKRLRDSIRRRCFGLLHNVLRATGQKKNTKSYDLLGYNWQELQKHLSSFPVWTSLQKQVWHIDHIFPIDAFIKNGIIDPKVINALDNLQPMLGKDNWNKSNCYDKRKFCRYLKKKYDIIFFEKDIKT